MKKIVFIFLIVIGFTAYSQNIDRVECTGVEAVCYGFELDSVTADTIQVEIIDMNGKGVVVPGVIECRFDTTYYAYDQLWSGKSSVEMSVCPRYKIKIDPTGFKRGAYFIRLNVFGVHKLDKLIIK